MSIISALIKLARRVVQQVQSDLTKQMQTVENEAKQPIRAMVEEVTSGVWIGEGADAFVEEVTSILVPGLNNTSQRIETLNNNITGAVDIIDRADEQVNQMVNGLADLFGAVY